MKTRRGLGTFIIVARQICTRSCGGRKWIISWGSHGVPSEGVAGVDCREGGDGLTTGQLV